MPTYVYRCAHCENQTEIVQRVDERVPPICFCRGGSGEQMDSVIVPVTFILKGSGWAKDGYSK